MKSPFSRSASQDAPTAVADAPSFDEELAPLTHRRAELSDRLRSIDAEIAELTSARTRQLLSGDPVSGPVGIAPLREERESVAAAIATLDQQIAPIAEKRAAAAVIAARQKLELAFATARESAESARTETHRELRKFVFVTFKNLMRRQRVATENARQAAAAIGQNYHLDFFLPTGQAALGIELERVCHSADPHLFGPE